ncbi:sugar ABC transporter permease [Paenibacillus sp. PAMC21692]|uniref:ABC transporter permease n=1 Tax=Paenibacillus sp. PAMC21692 TaxID=2762320 RepID=UPI0021C4BF9B|nr:ABC transporter permease subunit [Paenibacillus sp. PAMC21692]
MNSKIMESCRQAFKSPFLILLAVPGLITLFIFNYLPMYGVLLAFKDFDYSKGIWGSSWVGLKNFEYFLTSSQLFVVIRNTLLLNVAFIVSQTIAALTIAVLLNEIRIKWFARLSQSVIFLPYFMSWIVVGMITQSMLGGQNPTVNEWLIQLGLSEVNWYFEALLWPWILSVIKVWHGAGYFAIIYLAAITSIPEDLYEAARIDGASRFQAVRKITLPLLIPTISILTLLLIGRIFNGDFAMIYAIVGDNSLLFPTTDVIDTYVYRSMRVLNDFGMSSAVGLFQSVMGLVLVLAVNSFVRRVSKESALF